MLRLIYDDTGTQRDDVILQLAEYRGRGDSHYFARDRHVDGAEQSPAKVRRVLKSVFDQWTAAASQPSSKPVYLLAHLGEASTTWLKVAFNDRKAVLTAGRSTLEGHRIAASQSAVMTRMPPEFDHVTRGKEITSEDLLAAIDRSRRMLAAQESPLVDPTLIFDHYRGVYGTQLLTAAVSHFRLFDLVADGISHRTQLQQRLGLADRPMTVLLTALKAMGLLIEADDELFLTGLAAEHLRSGAAFDVSDYIHLHAESPEVLAMVDRLKSNRPMGMDSATGTAFIYRSGVRSAMDETEQARFLTKSLAGRARNVAPILADRYRLPEAKRLLDVGGGSGMYAIAYLARNPSLEAVVLDRPEVLTVAEEYAREFGVEDRLVLQAGDMFHDRWPEVDAVLLSNVLHDWDIPQCRELVRRAADAVGPGGEVLIHDVFLSDHLDGPLPLALYSAALFTITEGRAYSVAEHRTWLEEAGLKVVGPLETLIHCGVIVGQKEAER